MLGAVWHRTGPEWRVFIHSLLGLVRVIQYPKLNICEIGPYLELNAANRMSRKNM